MARPTRRSRPEASTQSISSFTRVSKSNVPSLTGGKKAAVIETTTTSRKRKLTNEEECAHPRATSRIVSFAPSSDEEDEEEGEKDAGVASLRSKRACRRQEEPTLVTKPVSPSPVKRTKEERLVSASTRTRAHKAVEDTLLSKSNKTVRRKLDSVVGQRRSTKQNGVPSLPQHLLELVELNKAFLRTMSIQMAHNGTNVPIDFKAVSSDISLSWGKRQVKIEDVLRCIAVQSSYKDNTSSPPFIVTDYGRGKICIELDPSREGNAAIDEAKLSRQFEENLRVLRLHKLKQEVTDEADLSLGNLSLSDLPCADVTNRDLGIKSHPFLAKGSRALSDIKTGLATKQQQAGKEARQATAPALNPNGTKMSLLDRLRFKQLAKENEALPPSGPELQRRAALNRVADVSATISTLCLSNPYSLPRQSFTMVAIQDSLRDSLRVPISKDEAAAAVRLLASEVAPQWLRLVTIGGRENVLVQRDWQPDTKSIQRRVSEILHA